MFLTPLSPMAGLFASEAEAAVGTRYVYEFSDGSVEHIALFQGANPDMGASVSSSEARQQDRCEHDPFRGISHRLVPNCGR